MHCVECVLSVFLHFRYVHSCRSSVDGDDPKTAQSQRTREEKQCGSSAPRVSAAVGKGEWAGREKDRCQLPILVGGTGDTGIGCRLFVGCAGCCAILFIRSADEREVRHPRDWRQEGLTTDRSEERATLQTWPGTQTTPRMERAEIGCP